MCKPWEFRGTQGEKESIEYLESKDKEEEPLSTYLYHHCLWNHGMQI